MKVMMPELPYSAVGDEAETADHLAID